MSKYFRCRVHIPVLVQYWETVSYEVTVDEVTDEKVEEALRNAIVEDDFIEVVNQEHSDTIEYDYSSIDIVDVKQDSDEV